LSFGWVWADKQKLRRKQNKKGRIRIVDWLTKSSVFTEVIFKFVYETSEPKFK
jgi:hypothetical protein